ncbi:hypothetical protein MAR_038110, partial [Mya arenaria]
TSPLLNDPPSSLRPAAAPSDEAICNIKIPEDDAYHMALCYCEHDCVISFRLSSCRLSDFTPENRWDAVPKSEVERFIIDCMIKVGTKRDHAVSLANNLMTADYRGHYSHGLNRLACSLTFDHLVILGDFNFPEIDWSTWTVHRNETHPAFSFVECLRDNFLNQHVQGVTRYRQGQDPSCLDLLLTDNQTEVENLTLSSKLGAKCNTKRGCKKPKWMDYYCVRKVKKKYHAWKRYTYSRSYRDYQSYCKIRNSTTKAIRFSKRKYQKGVAESSKTSQKSFWSFVKGETNTRSGIGDLRDKNGNIATEIKDKANILNDFFASVFTREDNSEIPNFEDKLEKENFISDIIVSPQLVTIERTESPNIGLP